MSSLDHARAQHERTETVTLGFWIYLMTDCILFASLFATYAVMRPGTYGGPSSNELFSLPLVFAETMILLTSSFSCALAGLAVQAGARRKALFGFTITALLGLAFLLLELHEFRQLALEGNNWQRSGFLSAYFTLVGTHGLHIAAGLIWAMTLLLRTARHGLGHLTRRQWLLFGLFWHFLDVVWIFIFSLVYLWGVL